MWINPDTKIHAIVKYLLSSSCEDSSTWSVYIRQVSRQYGLEDPLSCLRKDPPTKSTFKLSIEARIKAFHENELRSKSSLKYFNVSLLGLSGRHHPALSGLVTTQDVRKSRAHIKMLIEDLYTYEIKSEQSGGSPHCRLCSAEQTENISHILTFCSAYSDIRIRILEEYSYLCLQVKSVLDFSELMTDSEILCQFILDPSSFNLKQRIHLNDPLLGSFFRVSRDLCFAVNERRLKLLKEKTKETN